MAAEWIIDAGIGETRAALLEAGQIVEMRIERGDEPRFGDVWDTRLKTKLGALRGIVALGDVEALLEPLPGGATEGGLVRVEVVREAVPERGRPRLAKVRAAGAPGRRPARISAAPRLADLSDGAGGAALLDAAGWDEAIDQASSGLTPFEGGLLTITPTAAMTLIDVDGDLPPAELALAGARAAAAAIRRFDISGSTGVDLPSVGDRGVRQAVAAVFDALLPVPFERTAVNGFGFIQIVRPRRRASIIERVQGEAVDTTALALLRQAVRTPGAGRRVLTASPPVAGWLAVHISLVDEAARRLGARIEIMADASLPLTGGHVHAAQI